MGQTVVSIRAGDLGDSIREALGGLAGIPSGHFSGRTVLIKANFNSPHPYPASSDPAFIAALAAVLREAGAARIQVGDSCGLRWAPAEAVFSRLGIRELCQRIGAECLNFDQGSWTEVPVAGLILKTVPLAAAAAAAGRIVYATCLKTHPAAGFSISLKHAIGFLPPGHRFQMHQGQMAQKIADINLAVKPDLVFVDARKCFVAGGPARGWVRRPGLILASTDRVAVDVEGIGIIKSFFGFNRLRGNPWANPQIRCAVELGLGAAGAADPVPGSAAP